MKEHKIIKINQELYILSDEPIEKDSWFTDGKGVYFCEILLDGYIGFKKIIASTDTLRLYEEGSDHVPIITQEFKKSYLENPTETVIVEYELDPNPDILHQYKKPVLKVTSDNAIVLSTPDNNQEILSLISKVDDTLCHWEDYFKGEEGIDVTNARVDLEKVRKLLK